MGWFSDFQAEFESTIGGLGMGIVLPSDDPATSNFYRAIEAYSQNMLEEATRALAGIPNAIAPPFWVAQYGSATPEYEFGLTNKNFRLPVALFLIARRTSSVGQADIMDTLETIRDAIDSGAFEHFQAIERGAMDASDSCDVNQVFLATKVDLIGGVVSWSEGLLVGP